MNNFMTGVEKGRRGEDLAAAFLLERGYRILQRNWRRKTGEIDIIAEKSDLLVFCEVKSRTGTCFGVGAEAVDRRKQTKIIRTALLYLQQYHLMDHACRFDVIEIDVAGAVPLIRHLPNAFGG